MYSCRHNLVFSKSQYVFRRCLKTFTSIWHRQEIWLSWEKAGKKAGKITVDKLHSAHVCVPDKPLPTWHGKRKPSLISSVTCCRCYCSVISCVDQLLDLSVLRKVQFCSLCTFLYTHSFLSSSFFLCGCPASRRHRVTGQAQMGKQPMRTVTTTARTKVRVTTTVATRNESFSSILVCA